MAGEVNLPRFVANLQESDAEYPILGLNGTP